MFREGWEAASGGVGIGVGYKAQPGEGFEEPAAQGGSQAGHVYWAPAMDPDLALACGQGEASDGHTAVLVLTLVRRRHMNLPCAMGIRPGGEHGREPQAGTLLPLLQTAVLGETLHPPVPPRPHIATRRHRSSCLLRLSWGLA